MFYNTFRNPYELTIRVNVKRNYHFKFISASCFSVLSFVICLFVTNNIPDQGSQLCVHFSCRFR